MLRNLAVLAALALARPALAEPVPADCAALIAPLQGLEGYVLAAPPQAPVDGWCVFDGATLRTPAQDRPNASVERLRLRGSVEAGALVAVAVEADGLRVQPKAGDRQMDDRLRSFLRLQVVDVSLAASLEDGVVALRPLILRLGSGMTLRLDVEGRAGGLDPAALLAGRLTGLALDWHNDGRSLRPVLEMLGERLVDGAKGSAAVDAARLALRMLGDNLPETLFGENGRSELAALLAALPHGRGRLHLAFAAEPGIGAAQVAVLALSGDPASPEALGRFLDGARLELDWTPGLSP